MTDADLSGAVVTRADFNGTTAGGFTAAQLYSTASYQGGDLNGIGLHRNDLSGWDFAGENLTDADFRDATLTDADLSGAVVTGADFSDTTDSGFTAAQLYSTATLQSGDLSGIALAWNDLSGWDFAGKNLTDASFHRATLTDADLSLCDLRGAEISSSQISSAASTEGAILPDGRIDGLQLDVGERFVVRDDNGVDYSGQPVPPIAITVQSAMSLDSGSTLRMVFEDDDWGSTISFEPGIAVSLGGSLELSFAEGVDPADLIGATFDLFDWDGAIVSGSFDQIVTEAGAIWDTSNLYAAGEVTLVPEPSTFMLLLIALVACALRRRTLAA